MTNPSCVYTRNTYKTYVHMCENVYPLTNPSIHVRIRKKLWKYAEIKIWRWRFTTEKVYGKTCHFWPLGGARMHKTIGLLRHLSVDNQSSRGLRDLLDWYILSFSFLPWRKDFVLFFLFLIEGLRPVKYLKGDM